MNDAVLQSLHFERGLTEVLHGAAGTAPQLPAQRQLDPAEALAARHLQALLAPAGLAGELEAALAPMVDDRALLLPGAFRQALDEARALLARAAAGGDLRLQQALAALDEDLALRELAAMYRGVLHQG